MREHVGRRFQTSLVLQSILGNARPNIRRPGWLPCRLATSGVEQCREALNQCGLTHRRRPSTVGFCAEETQNLAGSLSLTTKAQFGSSKREQLIRETGESRLT